MRPVRRRQLVRRASAFTLVETLLAVAIIALLIGILLPTAGALRREARVTVCVNNQKQHAIGVQNYASRNRDALPNAPRSTATTPLEYAIFGPPRGPSRTFGGVDTPVNGFAIPGVAVAGETGTDHGVPTMVAPMASTFVGYNDGGEVDRREERLQGNSPAFMRNASLYNMYWMLFGDEISGEDGLAILNEVLASPSDPQGRSLESWAAAKSEFRGIDGRGGIADTFTPNPSEFPTGVADSLDNRGLPSDLGFYAPSYRYVTAAITDPDIWTFRPRDGVDRDELIAVIADGSGSAAPNEDRSWWEEGSSWTTVSDPSDNAWIRYAKTNTLSDVTYPAAKVLFFMQESLHRPSRDYWFQAGAITTLALADGSAIRAEATQDGFSTPSPVEDAGPLEEIVGMGDELPWYSLPDGSQHHAYFQSTYGGIRGRDIDP